MGMITIWLNDYPWLKYTVIGLMALFVLIAKDPQNWHANKIQDFVIDVYAQPNLYCTT